MMATEVKEIEKDNAPLIEQMMRDAAAVEEPGTVRPQDILHKGDETLAAPMMVSSLISAGWVEVWDTQNFERSIVNRNMLPAQLKKKRLDGSLVFTTINPGRSPRRGGLRCYLHADDPQREHYDSLGLAVCGKSNLTSQFQRKRHMQRRHKDEWETIEEERERKEKAEDREFQRSLLAAATGRMSEPAPVPSGYEQAVAVDEAEITQAPAGASEAITTDSVHLEIAYEGDCPRGCSWTVPPKVKSRERSVNAHVRTWHGG